MTTCTQCAGRGTVPCPGCNGSGTYLVGPPDEVICPKCKGTGQHPCPGCGGKGAVV